MPLWTNTTSDLYRENYDKIFRKRDKSYDESLTKNEYYDILTTEDCFPDLTDLHIPE
jgi:hypothetical protein